MRQSKENMDIIINKYLPTSQEGLIKEVVKGDIIYGFDTYYHNVVNIILKEYAVGSGWLWVKLKNYYLSKYIHLYIDSKIVVDAVCQDTGYLCLYANSKGYLFTMIKVDYYFADSILDIVQKNFDLAVGKYGK